MSVGRDGGGDGDGDGDGGVGNGGDVNGVDGDATQNADHHWDE